MAGAQVSITDGPETHANQSGEWTLVNAPAGTRMLEVRALGFYPERRHVDVVVGAAPVRVALSTLQAVLDTVRISATRRGNDRDLIAFQNRRRSGVGRYLTSEDVARRQPIVTSDLFRAMTGVRMEVEELERYLLVRGNVGEWCSPAIYLNGQHLRGITADEMDTWVYPKEIAGIEVYAGLGVPAQYQPGRTGCGSILIWTK